MVVVSAVPSPQFHTYRSTKPPGKGSIILAVNLTLSPSSVLTGPVMSTDGPVLSNMPLPLGVPTPVGPSYPARASQARSPAVTVPAAV